MFILLVPRRYFFVSFFVGPLQCLVEPSFFCSEDINRVSIQVALYTFELLATQKVPFDIRSYEGIASKPVCNFYTSLPGNSFL